MKFRSLTIAIIFTSLAHIATAQVPFGTNEGWQLVDAVSKKPLNTWTFEEMQVIGNHKFLVKRNGKYGVLDEKGSFTVPLIYPSLFKIADSPFYAFREVEEGLLGLMDSTGKITARPAFTHIESGYGNLFLAQAEGSWSNWGVIDAAGKWLEKPVHGCISMDMSPWPSISVVGPHHILFQSGNGHVVKDLKTQKTRLISDNFMVSPSFVDGIGAVDNFKGFSLVTYDGKVLIPEIKGEMLIREPFVVVLHKDYSKVFTSKGKLIASLEGGFTNAFANQDHIELSNDRNYLLIDATGKTVKRSDRYIDLLSSGTYSYATSKSQQFIVERDGKEFRVPEHYNVKHYNPANGLAVLDDTSGYDFIYNVRTGQFTVSRFFDIEPWKDDLYTAHFSVYTKAVVNGKTGEKYYAFKPEYEIEQWNYKFSLVDKVTRETIYRDVFDEAYAVAGNDSLFIVRQDYKGYFILNANQRKLSPAYNAVTDMHNGNFAVKSDANGKYGMINADFKQIMPFAYDYITAMNVGATTFYKLQDKPFGLADSRGKIILDTLYNSIEVVGNLIVFKSGKEYGFINSKGNRVQGLNGMTYFDRTNLADWLYCKLEDKVVLLNVQTEKVIDIPKGCKLQRGVQITGLQDHFYVTNGKYQHGIIDSDGKVIIPAGNYESISLDVSPVQYLGAKDHAVIFFNDNGKLGMNRVNGFKMVQYGYVSEISKPFMYALKNGQNGFVLVDENLKPVSSQTYLDLEQGEHAIIAKDMQGKYGAINERGEEVIPFVYDGINSDVWQYTSFEKQGKYHLYGQDQQRVFKDLEITDVSQGNTDMDDRYLMLQTSKNNVWVDVQLNAIVLENIISVDYREEIFYINAHFPENKVYESLNAVIVETPGGKGLFSLSASKYLIEPNNQKLELISYSTTESYLIQTQNAGKYNLYDLHQQKFLFEDDVDQVLKPAKDDVVKALKDGSLYVLIADYDHPDMKVIQMEEKYKKATFRMEYDLMVNGVSVLTVTNKGKKGILRQDGLWIHKPELESFEYYLYLDMYLIVKKKGLQYIVTLDGQYLTEKGFEVIEFLGDGGDMAHGYIGLDEYRIGEDGKVQLIAPE